MLVTSKGAYFLLNDRIFMLSDASFGRTPIGIWIDKVDFLTALGLKEKQKVCLKQHSLHFPGGVIRLQMMDAATSLQLSSLQPERIRECARMLQTHFNPKGVSSLCTSLLNLDGAPARYLNALCEIAHPLIRMLIQSLRACHKSEIEAAVKSLIGLGVGLTPSSDDVILGMLYTLLRIAPERESTRLLKATVESYAAGGTNAISAAYLTAVAYGAPFDRLDGILRGLAGEIPLDIEPILEIGSSSGSEMLLGLLIAAKLIYL